MSSEVCATSLSKRRAPLKALLLLLIFSLGSVTVSGTVLPLTVTDAHKATGSFLLTVSPVSILVAQGMNATSSIAVLSTQGFSGTVSLTAQVNTAGLALTFNPSRVNVASGGSAASIATVQAAKNASAGTYTIILTGTAVIGKKVLSSSVLLTVNVDPNADFGVSASPSTITVTVGFANSTSIVLYSKNGFNGAVALYATVPFGFLGVMGGQNPVTLTSGTTAATGLQVSATSSTALGKYNITITGVSGTVSHSCILTVDVVDPVPESLTLTGSSLASSTSLTLSLHNNGNTPVALQSYKVTDSSGDAWTLGNWTGPTVQPGTTGQSVILIGASCNTCTYSGVPFAFQQFITGHTYTITVTTKLNGQFTFTIVA